MRSAPTTTHDFAALHEVPGHVVGDQRHGDAVLHAVPMRSAVRPAGTAAFRRRRHESASRFHGGADDAERRAVAGRREGAGVAVREMVCPSRISVAPCRPIVLQSSISSSRIV